MGKNLRVDLLIGELTSGTFPMTFEMGETEHNGYKIRVLTTGSKLILEFTKGKKRIVETVRVDDLISPWILQTLGEESE